MAIVPAWHSTRVSDRNVYHNSSKCTEGNNIEEKYRATGTDGRPRCKNCEEAEGG